MRKLLMAIAVIIAVMMAGGTAMALSWTVSPYSPAGGTVVFGSTNVVGFKNISDPKTGKQLEGIYGAGFTMNVDTVIFDADLYTWDSYSAKSGWWDVFVVNINQQGYYWTLVNGGSGSQGDPIVTSSYLGGTPIFDNSVLPGATWAFGGKSYGDNTLESVSPLTEYTLTMTGGDPNLPYYVSVILDTKTDPNSDNNYPSWGSVHIHPQAPINPVPEPATMMLLGTGLVGLASFGRRRISKK